MRRSIILGALVLIAMQDSLWAEGKKLQLVISGANGLATPVSVDVNLPADLASAKTAEIEIAGGAKVTGQLISLSAVREGGGKSESGKRQLVFVLPPNVQGDIKATATIGGAAGKPDSFAWKDTDGKFDELSFAGRPVLKYMYEKLDHTSAERRGETYKVYHHVFSPDGSRLLTKGPGGLFPHHRGLFFGFNKITYGTTHADIWHCNSGEFQSHEKVLAEEAGPVLGRQVLSINWHGPDPLFDAKKKSDKTALPSTETPVFAHETRELTAYSTPGGTLIEFATLLESKVGKVHLDGDPQHAGFQFRATQEVPDKTAKETYYLRPNGKGKPGETINWDAKKKDHVNLPWNAVCITLDGKKYTVCYLDHPRNPKEARYSERDYARFGSYFEYDLDANKPLRLNYRIWVQDGEMTVEGVARLSKNFVESPKVAVVE